MDTLLFEFPTLQHKARAENYKQEFFDHGEMLINGSGGLHEFGYEEWLARTTRNRNPLTLDQGRTLSDTFMVIRESDGELIGMVDIRHNIDNPYLARIGGHIGYAVRPSLRNKGYGSQILQFALGHGRELGLEKVMLGAMSDNLPSIRLIKKYGGVLTSSTPGERFPEKTVNVYWIETSNLHPENSMGQTKSAGEYE